jgi:YhcN/YlaJ family sporulation lipoprotein
MRSLWKPLAVSFVACSILCACNAQEPPADDGIEDEALENHEAERYGTPFGEAPQVPTNNQDAQRVAERLAELATEVQGVNHANAVVAGRYAVVGINVDEDLDRSRVGTIKYSVAEALKADPLGAYAVVTADPDIQQRRALGHAPQHLGVPARGEPDDQGVVHQATDHGFG